MEGISVKSAKKTRGGELILEVAGKEEAESLKKTIVALTEGNMVEDVRGYQVQEDIFDIDGDAPKEEILRHIRRYTGSRGPNDVNSSLEIDRQKIETRTQTSRSD
ncbi:unnamed protein product [Diabrotica balteata]|uniref:Uncharacterized protein n=1 Tax=Diabrotica balteata TaxID=107213 RepID=A0A9P0DR21_DIABA|nr:unnamed protein product [Diabrotica balteata]